MPSRSADSLRIDPEKLKVAVKRLDEQLEKARENVKLLQDKDRKFEDLRGVLEGLPDKVTHPVMVPFGPLAFFEGQLVHTNEVLVQLSSEWFALKTAKHALGTVDRRKQRLRRDMDDVDREVKELEDKKRLAVGEGARIGMPMGAQTDPDGLLDIREPYEEGAETEQVRGVTGATVTRDAEGYFDIREPFDEKASAAALGELDATSPSAVVGAASASASGDWSSVRPDLARLRELERLDDDDERHDLNELDELDELVESYERTGLPPAGSVTSGITSGPRPLDTARPSNAAAYSAEIRSPADIYQLMSGAAGSPAKVESQAVAPARTPARLEGPLQQGALQASAPRPRGTAEKAFSGEVREHPARAAGEALSASSGETAAPKRLSKFKAERQATGS